MAKRITLNRLLSYIVGLYPQKEESDKIEVSYDLNKTKNTLEKSYYRVLNSKTSGKTIADISKRLRRVFDPFISDITRTAVDTDIRDINFTLLESVMYCLNLDMTPIDFRNKMIASLYQEDLFAKYSYADLKWKKKQLIDTIKECKNNLIFLRFLTDYLGINIFFLNVNEDKLYSVYPEENFNIFKPSVFLSYFDEIFEPLSYKFNKLWMYYHDPMKKLTNVDKKIINTPSVDFDNPDKTFQLGAEDLDRYLNKEEELEEEENSYDEVYPDEEQDTVETETEIDKCDVVTTDQSVFCKRLNSKDLQKMKLLELQTLAKKYKISTQSNVKTKTGKHKMKTKADLCKELISV